jgi:hypothetical protein
MMTFRIAPVVLAVLALIDFPPTPSQAAPANTLIEMWSHFRFCLRSAHLDKDVDLTLRFSLKRDGTLNGKPIISYFNMPDDRETERRNAAAIALAIDHCVPVQVSEPLGDAIAGRPMWIRFHGPRREKQT